MWIERDGFDFSLALPWGGDPAAGDPAWLTLIRRDDLTLTFNTAELIGDRTFRFEPEIPGPGDYLAIVEFVPYNYFPGADFGGLPLGEISGFSYGFYMSLDTGGNIVDGAEHELVTALEAYVAAFDRVDPDAGWDLVSARCQLLGRADLDAEMELAGLAPGRSVISIVAIIDGARGTVTYNRAHGTYMPGRQPYWLTAFDEPWVDEDGWRWDGC